MRNSDAVQTRGYIQHSNTGEIKQYTMKGQKTCNIAGWLYGPKYIEGTT